MLKIREKRSMTVADMEGLMMWVGVEWCAMFWVQLMSMNEMRCPFIPSSWQLLSHVGLCWACPPPFAGRCEVHVTTELFSLQGSKNHSRITEELWTVWKLEPTLDGSYPFGLGGVQTTDDSGNAFLRFSLQLSAQSIGVQLDELLPSELSGATNTQIKK